MLYAVAELTSNCRLRNRFAPTIQCIGVCTPVRSDEQRIDSPFLCVGQPPEGEQQVTKFSDDLARYLGLSRISDYTSHGLPAISEKLVSIDPDTRYPSEYAWLALGDTVSRVRTLLIYLSSNLSHH